MSNESHIKLHASLFGGLLLLASVHVIDYLLGRPSWTFSEIFRLDRETNVPTWYSSAVLAVTAAYAFRCYTLSVNANCRPAVGFAAVGLLFLALSCDEVATLHERIGKQLADTGDIIRHSSWPVVLGPIALVVAGAGIVTLRSHLRRSPNSMIVAVLGLGLIFASGVVLEFSTNLLDRSRFEWLWQLEIVVEEVAETSGALLVSLGLCRHGNVLTKL